MDRISPFGINNLDFQLLNGFQRDFPLVPRPFCAIGKQLAMSESEVLSRLQRLQDKGTISRVGAVFRPNAIGASTLAALAVPDERFDEVAQYVSGLPQVNHNYEREHFFNLWFVATATSLKQLLATLRDIERHCQCGPLLYLPMLEEFHIDLGFDLAPQSYRDMPSAPRQWHSVPPTLISLDQREQALVAALQDGLPIVPRPFNWLGMHEADALSAIAGWVDRNIVKRFGIIVRHRELGYTANAMAVWNVPDDRVTEAGRRLTESGRVSLCYRRQRQEPFWPYNLFCMIHGKSRQEVQERLGSLASSCGLDDYPHAVLFSARRFKQCGARYAPSEKEYARA